MEFKVLTDEEHLKIRPSMYIGSVDETNISSFFINENDVEYKTINIIPGLLKIINEIIDNSVDEHIRTKGAYANKINVDITNTLSGLEISVKDNGRGIPVVKPSGSNEYQPVLAWSRARSGTSFEKDRVTLGANGVGSFATYVFSESFIGETHDKKNSLVFDKITRNVSVNPSSKNFTKVTFQPDISLFNNGEFDYKNHYDYLKQRLINLSICYPSISFYFNEEKINISVKDLSSKFYKSALTYKDKNSNYTLIIGSTAPHNEFRYHAYTNGLHNPFGGSIVDYISSEISAALVPLITKKHKITVTNSQIKNNLLIAIYAINFNNLKFDSQTKEKITNSKQEVQAYFNDNGISFEKIAKDIIATPDIIDPIITAILYKKELAERLELARQQKKTKKLEIVNHIQASYPDAEERLLFITEGLCLKDDTEILVLENNILIKKTLKDISINDMVLTHKHNFKPVLNKSHSIKQTIKIKTSNGFIECSENHRFPVYNTNTKTVSVIEAKHIDISIHKFIKNKTVNCNGIFPILNLEKKDTSVVIYTDLYIFELSNTHNTIVFDIDSVKFKCVYADKLSIDDYLIL